MMMEVGEQLPLIQLYYIGAVFRCSCPIYSPISPQHTREEIPSRSVQSPIYYSGWCIPLPLDITLS